MERFWSSPRLVFGSAIALRVVLLTYGLFQDAYSPLKYTDIDYFVFTDAARYVSSGRSPYLRDTYRYTPLLAWMLYPTAWGGLWFHFGKVIFALGDVVASLFTYWILRDSASMPIPRALKFTSIWLLNPMVAQISTRGSSEGLLGVIIMALLWSTLQRRVVLTGLLLGFAVHFKIYPFVYAASIIFWLEEDSYPDRSTSSAILTFCTRSRVALTVSSALTFVVLNAIMYTCYGSPFLEHTYFYHLIRTDHRHNFSPYNTLLYLKTSSSGRSDLHLERLAFLPQLSLVIGIIPVVLAKKDLASTMLVQTFTFVAFNKVCTSQYFLWYMMFLPFYMPFSSMLQKPRIGITALVLWILGQVLWLQQGFQLEFLGKSTFVPGLWIVSILFFLINIWILAVIITDIRQLPIQNSHDEKRLKKAS
ncbi:MAG: GPI mannosyltransferase 1 [Bogoriella megaspora]|nr:MAG: GPI mannosyltransferase 1 [Bogoriella megaspora]